MTAVQTADIEPLDTETVNQLASGITLPPQPKVLTAINREIQKDEPSFARVAEYVSQDPAMSAKVLKIVNSPLYKTRREVTTIKLAVSVLGLQNFYCVVLMWALKESLGIDSATEELWQRTGLTAKLGEKIALRCHGVAPEDAYMVGLFQDTGLPLMIKKIPAASEVLNMVLYDGGDIEGFEECRFGTHHALLSYMLAKSWGLNPQVLTAIQYHHRHELDLFKDEPTRRLMCSAWLADHLARAADQAEFHDPEWDRIEADVLFELHLDIDDLEDLKEIASELGELI